MKFSRRDLYIYNIQDQSTMIKSPVLNWNRFESLTTRFFRLIEFDTDIESRDLIYFSIR